MTLVGMDSGEVRGLAARLRGQAAALMGVISHIDGIIHQISQHWHGHEAAEFVSTWQHRHRPNLLRIHQEVVGLVQSAQNNADQQDKASVGSGGGQPTGAAPVWHNGPNASQDQRLEADVMRQTRGLTAEQQLAWWNHLPDDQKWLYLTTIPAFLATMPGLSADMKAYAETNEIEVGETGMLAGTGNFKVFSFKAGVDESIEMDQHPNGETDVTIRGGALVSASKDMQAEGVNGSVGAGLEGDASVTYRFSSPEEAKAFYDQLTKGASPGPRGIETVAANIRRATSDPTLDVISKQYEGKLTGSVALSAGDKGEKVTINGDANIAYIRDVKAQTQTFQFSVDGTGAVQKLGISGAAVHGSTSVAIVTGTGNDHSVQEIVISGRYSESVVRGSDLKNVTAGAGGSYSVDITPDATNQQAVAALLHDLATGNTAGANAQLAELSKNATVVTQSDVSVSRDSGFNDQSGWGPAKVGVEGSLETDATTYTQTSVKAVGAPGTMNVPG